MKAFQLALLATFLTAIAVVPVSAVYRLEWVGTYESQAYDEDAAEKVAYDPVKKEALVANAEEGAVDVISLIDPTNPVKVGELDVIGDVEAQFPDFVGDAVQAIKTSGNLVFVAVEATMDLDMLQFTAPPILHTSEQFL